MSVVFWLGWVGERVIPSASDKPTYPTLAFKRLLMGGGLGQVVFSLGTH